MIWWTVKGSIILALAFAAAALLRGRPAAVRHAIWTVAIAAQLLIPLVPVVAPERTLAVPVPERVHAVMPVPLVEAAPAAVPPPRPLRVRLDARTFLIAGSTLLLLRLLSGTLHVALLARRSRRVTDGEWLSLHNQLCDALGISRPVTLRESGTLRLPVTWGVLYPTILLPAGARQWPEELRRHVLLHELAHVRRADALTQLLGQAALVLYWFNPLLWLAVRRMQHEAENACDDYVLRDGERPSRYAATLVELVRVHTGSTPPAFATLSVGGRSELETRVGAITHPLRDPSSRRTLLAAAVLAAVAIVVPLSALYPEEATCRSMQIPDLPFRETSGTMTVDGRRIHHFFLRPEPGRCVEAAFDLDARYTDDDRDLVPAPGLRTLVREARGGSDRAVFVEEADGRLSYRYQEDGRAASWDSAARRWYRDLMPEMVRRTEAGLEGRAQRILQKDGLEGLYAELARIPLPEIRAHYLLALTRLRTPAELPRSLVVERAREDAQLPDVLLAWLLTELVYREGSNDVVREDILAATRSLRSHAERKRVLHEMTHHRDSRVRVAAMEAIELVGVPWRRDLLQFSVPWYFGENPALVNAWFRGLESIGDRSERDELLRLIVQQELPASVTMRLAAELSRS